MTQLPYRQRVSLVLAVIDAAVLVLTLTDSHGPVRYVLGLVFGFVVPGWCVVGWMALREPFVEASLTLGVSISSVMILAQVLLSIHWWHLALCEDLLALVCLPILILQVRRTRSS